MSAKSTVSNEKWLIERKNKSTNYTERIWYTGPRYLIPKGWCLVKQQRGYSNDQ